MVNDISASFPEYWSRRMQLKHYRNDVYRSFVSMEEQTTLQRGDTVHRPKRSRLGVNDMGAQGNYTRQDITDTDASFTIAKEKEVSFFIRDYDELRSNYKTRNLYADEAATKLGLQIDGSALSEAANAGLVVEAADFGGTSGQGVTASTSNILSIFSSAGYKLDLNNAPQEDRKAYIGANTRQIVAQYLAGRDTAWGDKVGENGFLGTFYGFKCYLSNGLYWTASLAFATIPVAADTITINGVSLQAAANGAATNAGDFSISTTNDLAAANLVQLINGTGTAGASNYIEVSAANRLKLKGITASYDSATDILTLVAIGKGHTIVSETLTPAADIWTTTAQIQHSLFCQGNPVDLVIQKYPNMVVKDRDGYVGKDIVSWTAFDHKTFTEGSELMVDVKLRTDALTSSPLEV